MFDLTPSERRGALVFVCLLALGAGWDLFRARHPRLDPLPPVPTVGAATPEAAETREGAGPVHRASAAPLDLNQATVEELDALPGIGPVLARRIVDHRRMHGPFARPEDLLAVRGIGPRSFERLRPRVMVVGAGPGPRAAPGLQPAR